MPRQIVVNAGISETRVAVLDGGVLTELFVERRRHRSIVGNVYKGVVTNVLPGMQAAFVDIGLERAGFIHASDIAPLDAEGMESREGTVADIRALVREGQSLVVQVVKDPIGSKGARLTTHLSVSARYLVYMPQTRHIGISNRIEDEGERAAFVEEQRRLYEEDVDLLRLASDLVIDAVVQPEQLRGEVVRRLALAANKDRLFSERRHGVPPV